MDETTAREIGISGCGASRRISPNSNFSCRFEVNSKPLSPLKNVFLFVFRLKGRKTNKRYDTIRYDTQTCSPDLLNGFQGPLSGTEDDENAR